MQTGCRTEVFKFLGNKNYIMTLVVIYPVTEDTIKLVVRNLTKSSGATSHYQSFVFEKFFNDYLAIVNCSDESLVNDFPDLGKVRVVKKENTHFFINDYPEKKKHPEIRASS